MKVLTAKSLKGTEREVQDPNGGFSSLRLLLKSDGMGFSMTRTTVHPTATYQMWHYKAHLEACYCIKGTGKLKDSKGKVHDITPGTMYALNKHDKHWFKADTAVVLICVFNPPLVGKELHQADGSYAVAKRTA